MRVLHFIPSLVIANSSSFLKYKLGLFEAMAKGAEILVLTSDAGNMQIDGAAVKEYSPFKVCVECGKRGFGKDLSDFRPDIVHIHACWNFSAYGLFKECVRRKIPVVLTVDNRLSRWHLSSRYLLVKLPMWFMFQHRMLSSVEALHAISEQEETWLKGIHCIPGLRFGRCVNSRVAVVEAFNIVADKSAADMSDALIRLYQKVIDTSPFVRMTENERQVEDGFLKASLFTDGDEIHDKSFLSIQLSNASWRRIFLHSNDEGVLDSLIGGLSASGMEVPDVDVGNVDRFTVERNNDETVEKHVRKDSRISKIKSEGALPPLESELCVAMVMLSIKMKHSCAHRSDFIRIYKMLRFNDYDEGLVKDVLDRYGVSKFAARIMTIMNERYGLGEGFMPVEPLDDKGTETLRRKLFKSEVQ